MLPALRAIIGELKDNGIDAALKRSPHEISMCADYVDEDDFYYAVRLVEYFRAEVHLAMGGQDYGILGYAHEQVINDVLEQYDRHMHYLHGLR
ncbi:Glycine betaine transporter [BD1-7 clade bacterium]|uniref:Glycine betaine transporter n=1 Tax=BD1-7 clade bacterium TaxID=2029982 RepID=A0A5S9MUR0_9GAMM|nr:Glycine betaine transporter [BD1-7 clade bacterium]CAA0083726.1 Glycine betaine transporter [BD1-7 clade bacterium]